MKAAVLYQANTPLVIEDIVLDPPKAGEVRVKVGAAGVCRSDLHYMKGEANHFMPVVLGHEGAGTVMETGAGVSRVKAGDRVIMSFVSSCGVCPYCMTGRSNLCDRHFATPGTLFDRTMRMHKGDQDIHHFLKVSCFAEETVVPETSCVPIGDDLPMAEAALFGCSITTGVGAAIFSAKVAPGSSVAVVGCGGVGLNVIQGARLMSAGKIIAVDINDDKLEFARRFGATDAVNSAKTDPVAAIRELTDGLGADYTFEAFGAVETVSVAFNAARKGGMIVIAGLAPVGDRVPIDPVALVRMEKTLKGSFYGSARPALDMPMLIHLYQAGKLDVGFATRTYKLDEVNDAYQDLDSGAVGRGVITEF
jgi:NDMA-dependent alcohol dehydrogenase